MYGQPKALQYIGSMGMPNNSLCTSMLSDQSLYCMLAESQVLLERTNRQQSLYGDDPDEQDDKLEQVPIGS